MASGGRRVRPRRATSTCIAATPCTLTQFLAAYPNAGIHKDPFSGLVLKAGSGWATFDGNVDALRVGVDGATTVYDFEDTPRAPRIAIVSPSGNDLNGGTSYADAKKTIQAAIDTVNVGGTVHVDDGTYAESPNITKSLTLVSRNGRDASTINLQTGPTYLGSLTVGGVASDVTIDGFTIVGRDGASPVLAATNILVNPGVHDVTITNNRLRVGVVDGGSNGDDGIGIETTYLAHGPRPQPVRHEQPVRAPERTGQPRVLRQSRARMASPSPATPSRAASPATAVTQATQRPRRGQHGHRHGHQCHARQLGLPGCQPSSAHTTFRANTISGTVGGLPHRPDQ